MKANLTLINKIISLISFVYIFSSLNSQIYIRGIGVKAGGYSAYMAISYKEHLTQRISIEANLGKNSHSMYNNFSLQVMLQFNHKIKRSQGLSWYLGTGPSGFYWYNCGVITGNRKSFIKKETKYNGTINSVLGLECIIGNLPLSISIDAGPSFNLYPYFDTKWMLNCSVKYIVRNHQFKAHYRLSRSAYSSLRKSY